MKKNIFLWLIYIVLNFVCLQSAEVYINNPQKKKEFIESEINKLSNDKHSMEQFYFIAKMECYNIAKVAKKTDIEGALTMLSILEYPLFNFFTTCEIKSYFKNKFSKEILLKQRIKMHFNINEKFGNPLTPEHLRALLVCESLTRLNDENILEYKSYINSHKKNIQDIIKFRLMVGDGISLFNKAGNRW